MRLARNADVAGHCGAARPAQDNFRNGLCLVAVFLWTMALMVPAHSAESSPGAALVDQLPKCVQDTIALVKPSPLDIETIDQISSLCYSQLHSQALLNDFQIRKQKFTTQDYEDRIILWMVVIITISGVVLAAVPLIASYKLASTGRAEFAQTSELMLQRDRVLLKSSVTGLLILIASFAFFFVYVVWVYTIREVNLTDQVVQAKQSTQTESAVAQNKSTSHERSSIFTGYGGVGPIPDDTDDAH